MERSGKRYRITGAVVPICSEDRQAGVIGDGRDESVNQLCVVTDELGSVLRAAAKPAGLSEQITRVHEEC
jgi:hypothetical protein